jgi:hypothetical protein
VTDDVSVEWVNRAKVEAMFAGITDDLEHLGDPVTSALRAVVVPAATAAAPHASGRLAGSHAADRGADPLTARVTNAAPYARMVHNGTRYLPARPWLADTLDRTGPQWTDAVTAALQADLDEKASRT